MRYALALSVLFVPGTAPAQPAPDLLAAERLIAFHVAPIHSGERLGLEAATVDFGQRVPASTPPHRIGAHLDSLAQRSRARLVSPGSNLACGISATPDCIQRLVRIGLPRVTGDTAETWVYTLETGYPERLDYRMRLVRRNGGWAPLGVAEYRRTYLGDPALIDRRRDPSRVPAGCWETSVGTPSPPLGDDRDWTRIPARVRVDTVPGIDFYDRPAGWRVQAVPATESMRFGDGWLVEPEPGRWRMIWSSGFTWVSLDLRATGDTLQGGWEAGTDTLQQWNASVTLVRVECGS